MIDDIVQYLKENGESGIKEIAEGTNSNKITITTQLSRMHKTQRVEKRLDGCKSYYKLKYQ